MTDRIDEIRERVLELEYDNAKGAMWQNEDIRLVLSELDRLTAENRALLNVAKCARHTSKVIAGKNAEIARQRHTIEKLVYMVKYHGHIVSVEKALAGLGLAE